MGLNAGDELVDVVDEFDEDDFDEEFDDEHSYDSDDDIQGQGRTRLEMSGIHEMDANGGLTLDECNG